MKKEFAFQAIKLILSIFDHDLGRQGHSSDFFYLRCNHSINNDYAKY